MRRDDHKTSTHPPGEQKGSSTERRQIERERERKKKLADSEINISLIFPFFIMRKLWVHLGACTLFQLNREHPL